MASAAGEDTKARIIEAAAETLKGVGIVGASARAIARTGGFNQALIFYHFGSVSDLLLATVDVTSERRLAQYKERLAEVQTLPDLVAIASELHEQDAAEGHITVLAQMLAGAASDPELGPLLLQRFEPWIELVKEATQRVVAGTPYEKVVPVDELAFVVVSLFLGIELLTHLDPGRARAGTLFSTIGMVARLLDAVMGRSGEPSGGAGR